MIGFDLNDFNAVGTGCTIGGFVVVIGGILLYSLGVIRPLKASGARWMATTHEAEDEERTRSQIIMVWATLKSRTRNPQTVSEVLLAKDPGWPRRLRARCKTPVGGSFRSSSVPAGGSTIDGHGTLEFRADFLGESLPYAKTRLWARVGTSNFYFRLKPDELKRDVNAAASSQPAGPPGQPAP